MVWCLSSLLFQREGEREDVIQVGLFCRGGVWSGPEGLRGGGGLHREPGHWVQIRLLPREGPQGLPPTGRLLGEHQERLQQSFENLQVHSLQTTKTKWDWWFTISFPAPTVTTTTMVTLVIRSLATNTLGKLAVKILMLPMNILEKVEICLFPWK